MDLGRFLDLYISEARENVRLLQRSLLALETEQRGAAIDEAFRAAHTLKGISAAMGYTRIADMAHRLEDRLHEIRAGQLVADTATVDALLEEADALEHAITADSAAPPAVADAPASAPSVVASRVEGVVPADATAIAHVRLRADAMIKSARAMLVMRALADHAGVIGSDPETFPEDFDGHFRIFFSAAADLPGAQATIAAAGEVEHVEIRPAHAPAAAAPAAPVAAAASATASAPAVRQVRVEADRLDQLADGIGELSVLYARMLPAHQEGEQAQLFDRVGHVLSALQHDMLALRMVAVREVFERLPRVVRDAARAVSKDVVLVVEGDDVELDRAILDEIGEPLTHLLRNAVDHGIEAPPARLEAGKLVRGTVSVRAERERSSVRITVEDDGSGVNRVRVLEKARALGLVPADTSHRLTDEEIFRLLSHAGFSTAERVTAVSGRGVGMDVVANRIRALGGAIDMHTLDGAGTTFDIRLPITLALAQALLVRVAGEDYAIPLTHVAEAVELNGHSVQQGAREVLLVRGEEVPLMRLRRMLQIDEGGTERAAVIAEMGDRRAALAVDELVGREQILVKSFDAVVGMLPYFSGATLLADGRPALVIDPLSVI